MTCQENAQLTGPVSLFVGIEPETENWSLQQHLDVAKFAFAHKVSTLFLKVAEAGSRAGDIWYGGLDGAKHTIDAIKATGVNVIPYQFLYGGANLTQDIAIAVQLLQTFGVLCLDIEGDPWVGDIAGKWAAQLASALQPIPGKVWLSHPANFADAGQTPFMRALAPAVNVYMPMAYSDHLVSVYNDQLLSLNPNACVQPTLDMSQEFGANNVFNNAKICKDNGALAISLWYQGFAQKTPGMLDLIVMLYDGGAPAPPIGGDVKLNGNDCNCDSTRWYQLEDKESPDLCGPGCVILTALSNEPNGGRLVYKGVQVDGEYIDRETDTMVDDYAKAHGGTYDHINWPGSDDSDMIWFLNYARDKYQRTHYQVISSPTIERVRAAVRAGYPVLYSCNELDLQEKRTGARPPYPWHLSAGHILPCTGIDKDGDFITPDILNDGFQDAWPVTYVASVLAHSLSWACIIKLPFLANIPSGDPTGPEWKGFNAQVITPPAPTPAPGPDYVRADFEAMWHTFLSDLDVNTGFAKDAYANFRNQKFCGPPTTPEIHGRKDWSGTDKVVQYCTGGWYELAKGKITFYPYRSS